jgi:hypothetical protein
VRQNYHPQYDSTCFSVQNVVERAEGHEL